MMKLSFARSSALLLGVVLVALIWGHFLKTEAFAGIQTDCPVMGFAIDRDIHTDFDGKRIYFCCSTCPMDFEKDPARYMGILNEQGVTLEDSPGMTAAATETQQVIS